jgi:hypothetical protein
VHRNLAGEFIDQLFEPIFTPSCDHHSPPGGGKAARRSATKTRGSPGNKDDISHIQLLGFHTIQYWQLCQPT